MKTAIAAAVLTLAAGTAAAETVIRDNGVMVDAPEGMKAIFVPNWVNPDNLYVIPGRVRAVDAERAQPQPEGEGGPACTEQGDLTTGAGPCDE